MPTPVWTLSVDLQTRTATFQSGMSDAAKAARGSFQDIKDGAQEMGTSTSYSMTEARHGVMLLGEEFGVHLPRALMSFIASLGPIGAAMEAAFPFLAIVVGATLLLEHLSKLKAEGDKLTTSQMTFGTTVANVLNSLDEKLIQAGIRADELNHNHLAALNKELSLIDKQSLSELVKSFDVVAKAADVTFAELKTSWYQWGAGAAGAKHALESFKAQYDSLLAQGKDTEANDLLAGTRKSAEEVLRLQKQAHDSQMITGTGGTKQHGDYAKYEEAKQALQQKGIGFTEKEVDAQETLVGALQAQAQVQEKVTALKAAQDANATQGTQNKIDADATKEYEQQQRGLAEYIRHREEGERHISELRKKAAHEEEELGEAKRHSDDAVLKALRAEGDERAKLAQEAGKEDAGHGNRMAELQLAADKEAGQMRMTQAHMTAAQIADMELGFAAQEYAAKKQALNGEIAALDQYAKDYENKLKQLQNKQLELTRAHENAVTQITNKATEERNTRILAADQHMNDALARGMTQLLMRHEGFAKMISQLGDQMISGMMEAAIKSVLANDYTKESDAAAAARKAYNSMASVPYIGPALGAAAAASAFTMLMAFEQGGIVPGVGTGDTVPAMLTPGEAVLPKQMTEGLTNAAKFDNGSEGRDVHVHHHATYHISAIDGASVKGMLDKHADVFERHVNNHIRKLNR